MHRDYLFLDAISFAARAHEGQKRKDRVTPYAAHVMRVGVIVRHIFGFDDPRILTVAFLHDTIEDTQTDFDDIEERYGREIADWVSFLTKNKKLREEERERVYLEGLNAAPWQVKAAKLADLMDNLLDSESLSPEKKARSKARYCRYFDAFSKWSEPQLQKPLKIVQKVLEEVCG